MKLYDAVKQVRFLRPNKDVHECVDLVVISGQFDEAEVMKEVEELKREYAQWCLGYLTLNEEEINQEVERMQELMMYLVV